MSPMTTPSPSEARGNIAFGLAIAVATALGFACLPHQESPKVTDPVAFKATIDGTTPPPAKVPAPVVQPADALAALKLVPGYRAQLVAHEPIVVAPVAATFDEDGRLWVVEMDTYMPDINATGELQPNNRIVVLEDTNHDGTFATARVFLDGLVLPRAVAPCYGGALVLEPPSLFFCKDTDGDGKADTKVKLLDGFGGRENPEHAGNGLMLGLDNWYHFSQHSLEVRFDGEKVTTRPTPGHGQWGITTDDIGRLYYTPNSDPLLIDVFPKHYAQRNPHAAHMDGIGQSISPDKSVFPIHATPGVNRGYLPKFLREDKTLAEVTAACSPLIYRESLFPAEFRGSAFICDPSANVVMRMKMTLDRDQIPLLRRAYDKQEFLASPDERFRPVALATGPDGALYILDMYRGIIQHRTYETPYLKQQIRARSLESPLNCGRIYRVVPDATTTLNTSPNLSNAQTRQLVDLLSSPDGWRRSTAQRLLVERKPKDAAAMLRALLQPGSVEVGTLHALWTLEGTGDLTREDVLAALGSTSPVTRRAGIRLAEAFITDAGVLYELGEIAKNADRDTRIQLALSYGALRKELRVPRIASVLKVPGADKYIRSAAVSSLKDVELAMIQELASDPTWVKSTDGTVTLGDLADAVLRTGKDARFEFVEFVADLASQDEPAAPALLARIRSAQKLGTDDPKPIDLSAEPSHWLASQAERFNSFAASMSESSVYFDWPNRPPVKRVKAPRPMNKDEQARFDAGRLIFMTSCAQCHQGDGRGAAGMAPPLAGSARVEGPVERLARILFNGYEGQFQFNGSTYTSGMLPAPIQSDDELASVMTFLRRSWGNTADPVNSATVSKIRAENKARNKPWTTAELDAVPVKAPEKK